MTARPGIDRLASAVFTHLAEPGNMLLGQLLTLVSPAEALAAIKSGTLPGPVADSFTPSELAEFRTAAGRWRARLPGIPADGGITQHASAGITLLCPGDPSWPARLDDLGSTRPYALWVRGTADLETCSRRSVAVIGARAATAYGAHVGGEIAGQLARKGWTIISGAAFGVDASAHRAALAEQGATIAVLACGPDVAYPHAHAELLDAIAAHGAVVSEWPPGTTPTRRRFLIRNRTVAALAAGTVVIEAAEQSGTLNTARHATSLQRPLMAVPGPVTSEMSAGCHALIRAVHATCVTNAADVLACLLPAS